MVFGAQEWLKKMSVGYRAVPEHKHPKIHHLRRHDENRDGILEQHF
jgi:hypothetical protein